MLRTLGASRRQILTTVMVEAVAIGLLGALLGIAGGFLIAKAINALFEAFGIDLPTTSLVLESRTVVVALLVGLLVTLVSSLVPALRSTRVPPIAALHSFRPTPDPPPPPRLPRALDPARRRRPGRGPARPLRQRQRRRPRRPDGRRGRRGRLRRLALQPPPGAAAGGRRRLAAGAAAAPHRPPRPRERAAQPEPHRGHRGGADDRRRPGRLRHRLRRRAEEHGRPGRRRKLRRRPGHPEHRRLLADPERRPRRRPSGCPGVELVATIRGAEAKVLERRPAGRRRRGSTLRPRTSAKR